MRYKGPFKYSTYDKKDRFEINLNNNDAAYAFDLAFSLNAFVQMEPKVYRITAL